MSKNVSVNYFRKIHKHIAFYPFETIENDFFNIPEKQLEALWNFIVAGYPINFATRNYINLYNYTRGNSLDYPTAIKSFYSISFGIYAGIYVDEFKWFESN